MDKLLPIMLRKLLLSYTVRWDRPCTQHSGQSWASSITGRTWQHHVNILKNSCEHCENIMETSWEHKSPNRCYQCISLPSLQNFAGVQVPLWRLALDWCRLLNIWDWVLIWDYFSFNSYQAGIGIGYSLKNFHTNLVRSKVDFGLVYGGYKV
jgi:hypothetical protein